MAEYPPSVKKTGIFPHCSGINRERADEFRAAKGESQGCKSGGKIESGRLAHLKRTLDHIPFDPLRNGQKGVDLKKLA